MRAFPCRARAWMGWLVAGGLCIGGRAQASTKIEWDAPEPCPGTAALTERLSSLLGDGAEQLGGETSVRGVVSREGGGFRVVLEVNEAQRRSSRSLAAEDCADLTEAAALAIALAVHAQQALPAEPSGSALATPGTAMASSEESLAEQGQRGRKADDAGFSWSLGAEGVLDTGALPALAPGIGVFARARFGAPSIDLHGVAFPLQSLDVSPGEQVEFGLMLLGARGCYRFFAGEPSAAACVGLETGRLEASGEALLGSRRWRDIWLAPSVGLEGRQPLAPGWQLVLRAEALMPLLRKQYVVNENDSVHAPAEVDLRLSLGLSVGTD